MSWFYFFDSENGVSKPKLVLWIQRLKRFFWLSEWGASPSSSHRKISLNITIVWHIQLKFILEMFSLFMSQSSTTHRAWSRILIAFITSSHINNVEYVGMRHLLLFAASTLDVSLFLYVCWSKWDPENSEVLTDTDLLIVAGSQHGLSYWCGQLAGLWPDSLLFKSFPSAVIAWCLWECLDPSVKLRACYLQLFQPRHWAIVKIFPPCFNSYCYFHACGFRPCNWYYYETRSHGR